MPAAVAIGLGILFIIAILNRESFVPEFLEQSNVKRTSERSNSSYEQETNHVRPDGSFSAPPIQGVESPFRVNMVNSFIP
jgi:hypothetical protein